MLKKPKYQIITFGCQMNKSDSERVAAVLESMGYQTVKNGQLPDLVAINACSVRQTAIDRMWGYARNFAVEKNKRELITVLTGCLLEDDKKQAQKKFDLVFDIKNLFELERFLRETQMIKDDYFEILPKYSVSYQAFIPIMTGCNNFCSYCAVPYTRGREVSRTVASILKEVKTLVKNGCAEINLLGQNVNSFLPADLQNFSSKNPFKHNFARLLWEVNNIKGVRRLGFSSAHPKDMTDEVIQALALPKMLNYLHLALQSGNNVILKKMNRKYTVADYRKIIEKIRQVRPAIALGTDIIVGFPGETEKQFQDTLTFYQTMDFDICYTAKYSPRSGTVASKMKDNVPWSEKKKRWFAIQKLMEQITYRKNQKYVGKTVSVLIDKKIKNVYEGNSTEMKRVQFAGTGNYVGKIVDVIIERAGIWMLYGKIKNN